MAERRFICAFVTTPTERASSSKSENFAPSPRPRETPSDLVPDVVGVRGFAGLNSLRSAHCVLSTGPSCRAARGIK